MTPELVLRSKVEPRLSAFVGTDPNPNKLIARLFYFWFPKENSPFLHNELFSTAFCDQDAILTLEARVKPLIQPKS